MAYLEILGALAEAWIERDGGRPVIGISSSLVRWKNALHPLLKVRPLEKW